MCECKVNEFSSRVCVRGTKSCETKHGCNLHMDCDKVDELFAKRYPAGKQLKNGNVQRWVVHCDDPRCEDCFGS